MAQWYTQFVFKGDTLLGEGLADFALVEDIASTELKLNGHEAYTLVIVSGYALYGQLRGYYALGVAHVLVDPASGQAYYLSEQSARRQEPVNSLTPAQQAIIRESLIHFNAEAWETSNLSFRQQLGAYEVE
jgi:hypothetical protein